MRDRCEVCALVFEREHGYFTGAIVVGYALTAPLYAGLALGLLLLTGWALEWTLLAASAGVVVAAPAIFRYARVLWIYLGQGLDPDSR